MRGEKPLNFHEFDQILNIEATLLHLCLPYEGEEPNLTVFSTSTFCGGVTSAQSQS